MKKRFCVIVPARNERVMIEGTLRGLMAAGAAAEDIFVVDDCSDDGTGDIARSMGVHVLRNDPNLGKAKSIPHAAQVFNLTDTYEHIALMDADTLVDPEYFKEMLKTLEDKETVAACGRPISVAYNWLTAYRALCYANGHYVYRKAQGKLGMIAIAPGCSSMYRASVFNKLKWNNGTAAEDMYVTIQILHERLGKIAYAVKAKVYTQTPRKLFDYMKQMYRWYGGTWQVIVLMRVFFGNRLVDWECKLLWTEGFITAVLRLTLPFIALSLPFFAHKLTFLSEWGIMSEEKLAWYITLSTPWYSGLIQFIALIVGSFFMSLPSIIIFAWLERRWDIIRYSPFFPILWYVDVFYFLKAFWQAVVRKKPITWYSPARYAEQKGTR